MKNKYMLKKDSFNKQMNYLITFLYFLTNHLLKFDWSDYLYLYPSVEKFNKIISQAVQKRFFPLFVDIVQVIRTRTVGGKFAKGLREETVYEKRSTDETHITGSATIIKGLKKSLRYVKEEIDLAAITHRMLNR